MTLSEITRMYVKQTSEKFGHEQLNKRDYNFIYNQIRCRSHWYSQVIEFRNSPFIKSSRIMDMLERAETMVTTTDKLLNHYKKYYPKIYSHLLKLAVKKDVK